jgi:hypothetical protein
MSEPEELFAAPPPEEALALGQAVHPEDEGSFVGLIRTNGQEREASG